MIQQIWDPVKRRYIEQELDLCGCLPVAVRLGLSDPPERLCDGAERRDDREVAQSA